MTDQPRSDAPDAPLYGATPVQAFTRYWRRYAVFTGRASLSEFWWAALANTVLLIGGLLAASVVVGIGSALRDSIEVVGVLLVVLGALLTLIAGLAAVAAILPGIAIGVRRLHDADLSGLFLLLHFVPSVGGLIVLVLHVLPTNPAGRRYDADAVAGWQPEPLAAPLPFAPYGVPAPTAPYGDPVGSAEPVPAATTPVDVVQDVPAPPRDAVHDAWSAIGTVERVPRAGSVVPGRGPAFVRVLTADGGAVLATDGMGVAEGAAPLGAGAELYLPSADLAELPIERVTGRWEVALLSATARRIAATGVHLPADLEQYGAISVSLPVADAPAPWNDGSGTVGVLLGVPLDGVPEAIASDAGELRLVGVAPLHPEELRRILDGGRAARSEIAGRLAALPPSLRFSPDRTAL